MSSESMEDYDYFLAKQALQGNKWTDKQYRSLKRLLDWGHSPHVEDCECAQAYNERIGYYPIKDPRCFGGGE